jgi:hypothetical protein
MRRRAQVALAPTFRPEPRDPQQGLGLPEQQYAQISARETHRPNGVYAEARYVAPSFEL